MPNPAVLQELADLARFTSENPNPVLRVMPDGSVLYANDAAIAVKGLLKGRMAPAAVCMALSKRTVSLPTAGCSGCDDRRAVGTTGRDRRSDLTGFGPSS